ncbi:MAG: NADH-quinone oxidoreductase subunit J [Pleurocapsa minor GSE-CHR-MK-17-07R]|jgi:NADH-quinone oxidoreductase subunit J|nr:NADH-quinone oxidoreductase subunit J [Pleurocapsa minor GSE-CHR-MK 17-07R]
MTEVWLFIIAGALAVAAAVMMLLSENAVHSALFLIVTMVCIALLFLMLDSPFLAMIQITVYAGAIMVLFLFVIMLLGAEKLGTADPGPEKSRFRWFTPVALSLALALLFSIGLVTIQGNIDAQEPPVADPTVRVVNVSNSGPVDVYVGSLLLADDLAFGQSTSFASVPVGEYTVSVRPASGGETTAVFDAVAAESTNIVAHGPADEAPGIALFLQDMRPLANEGDGRITIFNAKADSTNVAVVETDTYNTADGSYSFVRVQNLAFGFTSILELPNGDVSWRFLNDGDGEQIIAELFDEELRRDSSNLIVLADEVLPAGTVRTLPLVVTAPTAAQFGSPRAIGYSLFTEFLLPFQVLGLLLLAAMVGVIVLTQREIKPVKKIQQRRKVSRPLTSVITAQVGQEVTEDAPRLNAPATAGEAEPVK